ncbi:hypothetical protein J3R03_004848 [Actinoplanes couchii]|nr:hypothetical protein [Actinoplanes couchii]
MAAGDALLAPSVTRRVIAAFAGDDPEPPPGAGTPTARSR